jgi:hypothetical protein
VYPTTLTQGDLNPDHARPWQFTNSDIFRLTGFSFQVGGALQVNTGPADLGIGHCSDGAVWVIVIPRSGGTLFSSATNQSEAVGTVWLRFHTSIITNLFPAASVFSDGDQSLLTQMNVIANVKMNSSYHSGNNAMIPDPKDMTVDVDTQGGPRRFFVVDTQAQTAQYINYFEQKFVPVPPAITSDLAQSAFDQLWQAFDQNYAMFVIRPDVDWTALRGQYRPLAAASKSTYEFAGVCAEMLRPLRDLHVWLTVAGAYVPVFNRPRSSNFNPDAFASILGGLNDAGSEVQWAITTNQIGYIAIDSWSDDTVPAAFDQALMQMRATRALIIDVRMNGGGSENLAQKVAGRFLDQPFTYAYDQVRTGPSHTDLSAKNPRQTGPGGQWRYDRPVLLLIGQRCMSSNESFVAMMAGAPQVTTMGDHTAGSSGNPRIFQLPLAMSVSVSQWIDYLPDGTLLDEHGVLPQLSFVGSPEAFQGTRDDLLSAALERLKSVPLPDKPIQISGIIPAGQWPGFSRGNPEAVALYGNFACVAAGALQVLDISNPAQPRRVGFYPGANQANGIAVVGHYAYVTDQQTGLLVIDLSDPANPKRVGSLQTDDWTYGLAVSGNFAYVTAGQSLEMVDISNPQQPMRVGSYGTNVSCAAPSGDYVCVGEAYANTGRLEIVDLRNPQHPQPVGTCQTASAVRGLAISGSYAYVADGTAGLLVVNIADPAHPQLVGTYSNAWSVAVAVAISGQQVFLADEAYGLRILDVSDPTKPRQLGQVATGSRPTAVAVSGTNAYVTDSGSGLEVFSISDPVTPQRSGYFQVSGLAREVAISGDFACVADWEGGMQVISIADAANPQGIASFNPDGRADVRSVATAGNYACMADYSTGLYVIDLAATGGPRQVGFIPIDFVEEVAAFGSYAYVMDANSVLHVIDLTTPAKPQQRGVRAFSSGYPAKLAIGSNYLYVATSGKGLTILDISVPTSIRAAGWFTTNWVLVRDIAASGNYLYVAEEFTGLQVIDISNPAHAQCAGSYTRPGIGFALPAYAIAVSGSTAYLIESGDLDVLDVTTPPAPKLTSWLSHVGGFGIALSGNKICVTADGRGLSVLQQIPSSPHFDSTSRFNAALFQVSFSAEVGQQVQLQRSRDLSIWEDWTNVTAVGSTQAVDDPDAASHPRQFYRAVIK